MTYLLCILWTLLMAVWSAADDAKEIAANEPINHPLQWVIRALGVGFVCAICDLWWFAIPMGALFSMVFRFTLNRLRGLDWRYVSPSSWYDYGYLMATSAWCWKPKRWTWLNWQAFMRHQHWGGYDLDDRFKAQVHRAGLLAYIAEAVVVLIFVLFV